ncbi:MAG: hypothetical protein ACI8Z0_003047, partial [Lentimonas sp.]
FKGNSASIPSKMRACLAIQMNAQQSIFGQKHSRIQIGW